MSEYLTDEGLKFLIPKYYKNKKSPIYLSRIIGITGRMIDGA